MSFVMFYMMKRRDPMLAATIPTLPRKIKTLASKLANINFNPCFKFKRNPFQADGKKLSPLTAI